jgi:hypothetical protein
MQRRAIRRKLDPVMAKGLDIQQPCIELALHVPVVIMTFLPLLFSDGRAECLGLQ